MSPSNHQQGNILFIEKRTASNDNNIDMLFDFRPVTE
jgi:hypothetical protein